MRHYIEMSQKRTNKRRVVRLQRGERGAWGTPTETQITPKAKAQEPIKVRIKFMLAKIPKFATLNIRGIKKP